jgi:hypothetical protein
MWCSAAGNSSVWGVSGAYRGGDVEAKQVQLRVDFLLELELLGDVGLVDQLGLLLVPGHFEDLLELDAGRLHAALDASHHARPAERALHLVPLPMVDHSQQDLLLYVYRQTHFINLSKST